MSYPTHFARSPIYVLEKGRIVEQGTHETLLAALGLYYAMWRQQIGERGTRTFRPEADPTPAVDVV